MRDGKACHHLHLEWQTWEETLTATVGARDAVWDWTVDGPEVPEDELTRLLRASTVVNPAAVIDGMLRLVQGDTRLEAYLTEVRHSFR